MHTSTWRAQSNAATPHQPTDTSSTELVNPTLTTSLLDSVPPPTIQVLGAPVLRAKCKRVTAEQFGSEQLNTTILSLHSALHAFRKQNGFGRGLAAPQIGVAQRIVALNLGAGYFTLINPQITQASPQQFTLWDDCLSFPWLMVRRARSVSLSLTYQDETGKHIKWHNLDRAVSELLQHELNHLDGILSVDQPYTKLFGNHLEVSKQAGLPLKATFDCVELVDGVVSRAQYEHNRHVYDALVDYTIKPTV